MKNYSLYFFLLMLVLIFSGCSELKNENAPTQAVVKIHGDGFADITSANFHLKYVRSKNYDIQPCKQCHGGDFSGGTANFSCMACHYKPGGPENCTTCHGSVNPAPPKGLAGNTQSVGAHQKHLLGGIIGAAVSCTECHVVPAKVTDPGHLDASAGAEFRFNPTSVFYRSNATYGNGSCANTYCHGNFTGGNNLTMTWTSTSSTAVECGTCHGDITKATLKEKAFPKTGHQAIGTIECYQCHSAVVDVNMAIINPAKHINGRID